MRRSSQVYVPTSAAPAQARQFLVDYVTPDLGDAAVVDDAALALTELVTNALNAGSERIVVDVELGSDYLLVAVTDDAPGQPQIQPQLPTSTHGRGLHIVEALARRWGTDPWPPGKKVWAELAVDATI